MCIIYIGIYKCIFFNDYKFYLKWILLIIFIIIVLLNIKLKLFVKLVFFNKDFKNFLILVGNRL